MAIKHTGIDCVAIAYPQKVVIFNSYWQYALNFLLEQRYKKQIICLQTYGFDNSILLYLNKRKVFGSLENSKEKTNCFIIFILQAVGFLEDMTIKVFFQKRMHRFMADQFLNTDVIFTKILFL